MRQPKIVIVGAGLVGGSAALFAALTIPSAELVIIDDVARVRAEGQAMDLAHAAAFWDHNRFYAGDYDNLRDAEVVVITAGVGVKPGQTRLDLARKAGFLMSIIYMVVWVVIGPLWWKLLGRV
jgi:L-lactate dehydrogenase